MKKIMLTLAVVFLSISLMKAQTPDQFKYQATLRNSDGTVMSDKDVEIGIKILEGSESGSEVFTETHNVTTSEYGVISLNIGSDQDLSVVNWSKSDFFLETSVDGTVIGTSQILATPYSVNSKASESINVGNDGLVMKDFVELTDTTDAVDNYLHIDYPDGYNQDNTRIISFEVKYMGATWMNMGKNGDISVGLGGTKIYLYYTDANTYKDKLYRLIIAKIE